MPGERIPSFDIVQSMAAGHFTNAALKMECLLSFRLLDVVLEAYMMLKEEESEADGNTIHSFVQVLLTRLLTELKQIFKDENLDPVVSETPAWVATDVMIRGCKFFWQLT